MVNWRRNGLNFLSPLFYYWIKLIWSRACRPVLWINQLISFGSWQKWRIQFFFICLFNLRICQLNIWNCLIICKRLKSIWASFNIQWFLNLFFNFLKKTFGRSAFEDTHLMFLLFSKKWIQGIIWTRTNCSLGNIVIPFVSTESVRLTPTLWWFLMTFLFDLVSTRT